MHQPRPYLAGHDAGHALVSPRGADDHDSPVEQVLVLQSHVDSLRRVRRQLCSSVDALRCNN